MQKQFADAIEQREILRYLGYRGQDADEAVLALIAECRNAMAEVMSPKLVYRRYPLSVGENGNMEAGGLQFQSRNLAKNLLGCEEVILFAATLGSGVDRLMNRYSRLAISQAAVLQAVGAAAIEAYCNQFQEQLARELEAEGKYLRPRFSPGYGDLPLTIQKRFLEVLEASKRIGIYLSEGDIMLPEKSVTAMIGVSRENVHCVMEGCEMCAKSNCIYRRST